jgi:ADP-ribose pyrophosphatase YjhB (NUDIX family)
MKLIDTIYEKDFRDAKEVDRSAYYHRTAVRAVLVDENGGIFLMHVGLHGYHKLPGGGIKEGEEIKLALARELLEEVGCKAEILDEVGEIVEYRDFDKMKQTSYCYIAKQIGQKTDNALEEDEIAEQMEELKAKNIDHAVQLSESDMPDNIEGLFVQRRDLAFLREAKRILQN